MSLSLSSSSLRRRLVVVAAAGVLAAGVWSSTAGAETPAPQPGRVGGLVLDRSNQPLAAATVTLTDSSGAAAGSAGTDHQGRFAIAVPQGDYDIAVAAQQDGRTLSARVRHYSVEENTKLNLILAGDPSQARTAAASVAPSAGTGESTSAGFTRAAAAQSSSQAVTFSGRVVNADGDPVTRVAIRLRGYAEAYPDSYDETFSLDAPAGTYTLEVETDTDDPDDCPGCPDYRTERQTHRYTVDNFHLGADRQETIHLPRPAVMTVTVVDPDNRPVQSAWVTSWKDSPGQPPAIAPELFPGATPTVTSNADVLTRADGTAPIEYFPGTHPTNVSVEPPAGTQLPAEKAVPSDATSLTIRLQDGPTLRGRLFQTGDTFELPEGYIYGENGSYPIAVTQDGYAVTAPPGRYQMYLEVSHQEEGESSDYWLWGLDTGSFDIVGDQVLDLNVPLGLARLWIVDDQGQRLPVYASGYDATSDITIGGGIRATTHTESWAWPDQDEYLAVIGPSLTDHIGELDDYSGAPSSAYVAPGEHTVIAFVTGTGPGYPPNPSPSTTTTTQPTTTTQTTPKPTNPGPVNDPPAGPASQPGTPTGSGYWTLSSDGTVHRFGEAAHLGNSRDGGVDIEPTPTGNGYWTLNRSGSVQAFGDATKLGDVDRSKLANGEEPASLSATPSGTGYWVFTSRGRAIPFGDAPFLGDVSTVKLNGPVLDSVATPTGRGYYMVASDGGIFTFGDAAFAGSMGGQKLNAPVQSLVPDSDGHGYWLVASDGGIFAFDAPFRGSLGGIKLNKPVLGMVRYGDGYLMVGADGGIFNFSTQPFAGSLGDKPPASPVVAVAALP